MMPNQEYTRAVLADRAREREHAMFLAGLGVTNSGVAAPRAHGRVRTSLRNVLARLRRPPVPVPLDLLPALERRAEVALDLTRFPESAFQEQGTAS
jgi:hypothetical protein